MQERTHTNEGRILLAVALVLGLLAGCESPTDPKEEPGDGNGPNGLVIRPADPPYASTVTFPSGLKLDNLVQDPALTLTFPDPAANPWGAARTIHYARVGYFIVLAAVDGDRNVSQNFKLREYTDPPRSHGDTKAYIDAAALRIVATSTATP
jgi:hypothetical protein